MKESSQVCRLCAAAANAAGVGPGVGEVVHVRARPARRRAGRAGRRSARPAPRRCPHDATMTSGHGELHDAAVPMLPPAALSPAPCPSPRSGKKNEMLAIEEAKLPPPTPASAASASRTPKDSARMRDDPGQAAARDEQQQRGDDGPVAASEPRHGERVGDPDRRAHEARHRDQPELLVHGQAEPGPRQQRYDDAPQRPHAEAEELGVDRQGEVASGDPAATTAPERGVLGVPVVDPPAGAVGGCGGGGRGEGGIHLERRDRLTCGGRHAGSFSGAQRALGRPGKRGNAMFPRPAVAVKRP